MSIKKPKKKEALKPVLKDLLDSDFFFEKPLNNLELSANQAYNEFIEAPMRMKLRKRYEYRRKLIRAIYAYTDPKLIPGADLKIMAEHTSDDYADLRYFLRAHSPVTAIRAYCVNCQSHSVTDVRNCTNGVCPLYPFRMGSNPFYGKIADADREATEDFNEVQENGDNPSDDKESTGNDTAGATA